MSSGGNSGGGGGGGGFGGGGGGGGVPQQYFCYQCNRTVSITPVPTSDLICPSCNGGFLEEYEAPNPNPTPSPNPNPNPFFSFSSSDMPSFSAGFGTGTGFPLVFPTSGGGSGGSSFEFQNPTDLSGLFGGPTMHQRSSGAPFGDADAFNPFHFLQNYLQNLRAGGANIQFVIENNSTDPGLRLPANLGDYFIGPGLEQLIQQLAENDPNRYGTPPASKSAIEGLPIIKITKEMLDSDSSQCAVCKDTFEVGSEAKQMPCKHIYHSDCIHPWLEMHNSCPVCRYELPTDDPEYEQQTQDNRAPTNPNVTVGLADSSGGGGGGGGGVQDTNSGGTSEENPQTPRTVERRFRISLPWLFRAFGSPAETSNSGSGNSNNNNNGGNDGESNSGGRGNQHSGSQPRQEDLD